MSKIVRLTSKNGTVKQFAVANKVKFDGQISLAKAEVFDPATGKVVPAKIRTTKKKTIISYNDGEREAEIHLQGTVDGSSLGEASSALSTGDSTGAEASFDAPAAGSEASGMPAMAAQEGGFGTTLALGALGLAGLGGVIAAAGASGKTETPQAPRDTTAPIFNASASSPADNSVTAPVGNDIILRFDEAISSSSDLSKVTLKDAAGNTVEAAISVVDGNVVINPAKDLAFGRTYHVEWGAGALRDEAGNAVNAASDAQTFNFTTATANVVEIAVAVGQVLTSNRLTAALYDGSGNLLATAELGADGKVAVDLGSYRGVIIARVAKDADSLPDYLDEATGQGKDLDVDLFAMGAIADSSNKLSLNINVLSTVAYKKAIETIGGNPLTDGAQLSSSIAEVTNTAIAKVFGLERLHDQPIVTVNGANGYNPTDGVNQAEKYGEVLAVLSGVDAATSSSEETLAQLAKGIVINGETAKVNAAVTVLLNQGAAIVDEALDIDTLATVASNSQPTVVNSKIAAASSTSDGKLVAGTVLTLEVRLSEVVEVSGTPRLALNIAGQTVYAELSPLAAGSDVLTFTYTLQSEVSDPSAISIPQNALDLTSGQIIAKDNGQSVITISDAVAGDDHKISLDTLPTPTVTQGVITLTLPADASAVQVLDGTSDVTAKFTLTIANGVATLTPKAGAVEYANAALTVKALDAAGNMSAAAATISNYTFDNVAPTGPTLTAGTNGTIVVSLDADATSARLYDGNTDITAQFTAGVKDTTNNTITFTPNAGAVNYTAKDITATASDASGNESTKSTGSLSYTYSHTDSTAPTIGSVTLSTTGLSVTSTEAGSAGLYSGTTLLGTAATLTANTAGTITATEQASVTTATLKVADSSGNTASSTATYTLGTAGVDAITGQNVWGFGGNDTLTGTANADSLYGGAGADRYVFAGTAALNGSDTIELSTDDILDFTAFLPNGSVDQNGGAGTAITAFNFASGGNKNITGKVAFFDTNGAGLTAADIFAELTVATEGAFSVNGKAIVITGDASSPANPALIYYIDSALTGTAAVDLADIILVGTTSANFDIDSLTSANFAFPPVIGSVTLSASGLSVTSNEAGTAALYSGTTLLGTATTLTANTAAVLAVAEQASVTQTTLKVADNSGDTTSGTATYTLGTAGADTITGQNVWGFGGNDTLTGTAGKDTLFGGDGADIIEGGADKDTIDLGTGSVDTLVVNAVVGTSSDSIHNNVAGGTGWDIVTGLELTDKILIKATNVSNFNFAAHVGIDTGGIWVNLNNANGYLDASDIVISTNLTSATTAQAQAMVIMHLTGTSGNDTLYGGANGDTFVLTASGNDSLYLGANDGKTDTIVYNVATVGGKQTATNQPAYGVSNQYDNIRQFETGIDKIELQGMTFSGQRSINGVQEVTSGSAAIDARTGVLIVTSPSLLAADNADTAKIASAITAAYDLSSLADGEELVFAVRTDLGNPGNSYFFGIYHNTGTDDVVSAADIQIFGATDNRPFAPSDMTAPTITAASISGTGLSVTSTEAGSAGLYSGTTLLGTAATLTANTAGTITATEQASVTTATLKVADSSGNTASSTATYTLGTAGVDAITGQNVWGFGGNDTLTGTANADSLYGGDGADTIIADDLDLIDGELGNDTVEFAAAVSATNLTDTDLVNVENIRITGTAAAAYDFSLQTEALTITGGAGSDTIKGGKNVDRIDAGGGKNIVHLGAADGKADVYVYTTGQGDLINDFEANAGQDVIEFSAAFLVNGAKTTQLKEITTTGTVADGDVFIELTNESYTITDATMINATLSILNGLNMSSVGQGDRVVFALNNIVHTYLWTYKNIDGDGVVEQNEIFNVATILNTTNISNGDLTFA